MATIFVDNVAYQVEDGQNLLNACLSLGLNLPYFCWHPAMHSVGACRQCAVKQFRDENDTRGRIVMACMTPAIEGTRISIEDAEARAFRASVIEWLMVNHPHDCPVCDEGGECHLQDMTLMSGHVYRRYRFKKRTYRNQYLGPFVAHEMNRCIQCYRCVQFYRDYAGGHDLNVFASRDRVYFGREEDGVLENEFSGNLVEVCPTGVFTDKTLSKHYTRKWDFQTAPSICVHCGVGCNTMPGERYNELRRIRNRFNRDVNGYFLCDRGRYGYEFVNSSLRVRQPLLASGARESGPGSATVATQLPGSPPSILGDRHRPVEPEEAVRRAAGILAGGRRAIGIGSPRASLEANFALRTLVGPENFYLGMEDSEARLLNEALAIMRQGPSPSPSLDTVRSSDAVLVLGEDVTNVAPVLALALRQTARQQPVNAVAKRLRIPLWDDAAIREAVQNASGPFFVAHVTATKLDEVATASFSGAPDDIARLGFAIARAVESGAPPVAGLSEELRSLAENIARTMNGAECPVVVTGPSLRSSAVIRAAANVAWALRQAGRPATLAFTAPECNSLGLAMIGGGTLGDAFRAVLDGSADTVVILENDLYRRAGAADVDAVLDKASHVIAIDSLATPTTDRAELVLPAGTFAESDGTFVNSEGRAQRFYQVFVPIGNVRESWRWMRDLMTGWDRPETEQWNNLDAVVASMVRALPQFQLVAEVSPPAGFRIAGQKIARQHQRYSGRTAMTANIDVSEPKPPEDPDSPFVFSMEGFQGQPPAPLVPRIWAPGWNSEQALTRFQEEVGGPIRGGPSGRRLIEPEVGGKVAYFDEAPDSFQPRDEEWLLVPLYHIFGSEELSVLAAGVAERTPPPYLALGPVDAGRLGWQEGDEMDFALADSARRLPVRVIPSLPAGVAGLPSNLPELRGFSLPAWVVLPAAGREA